jgi:hypothetical protein
MISAAVDNDVLIKLSAYDLLDPGLDALGGVGQVGVLGAARFVVPAALERDDRIQQPERAIAAWRAVGPLVEALEPSEPELQLAAALEERAARRGLPLDAGESQLISIVVLRAVPVLATGDKRAIEAAQQMRTDIEPLEALDGRVVCLEQIAACLVESLGSNRVRVSVCEEPGADRAMTICMGCAGMAHGSEFSDEGLLAYIAAVRESAPTLIGEL